MGAKPTRQTRATKANIRQFKQNEVSRVTENINQVQTNVLQPNGTKSNAVVTKVNQQVLAATFTAQNQLQKGGTNFTKDDMVAIAIFIKTASTGENMFMSANQFSSLTREDLVTLIRTIVFDPVEIQKLASRSEHGLNPDHMPVQNHVIYKAITES